MKKIDETTLVWRDVEPTKENLTEVFKDKQILGAEPIDTPLVDGLYFTITDLSTVTFAEVSINDELIVESPASTEQPLVVRVSDPVSIAD